MCGIIAVVRRRSDRPPASSDEVLARLDQAAAGVAAAPDLPPGDELASLLTAAAAPLVEADRLLRGAPGVRTLLADATLAARADALVASVDAVADAVEAALDRSEAQGAGGVEGVNVALSGLRDATWALRRDRLPTAAKVAALAGPDPGVPAIEGYLSIQQVLSAIDRLEVRGRDSAGVHLLVRGHGLDLTDPSVAALLEGRLDDDRFVSGAVRVADGHLAFVYKAAAEIGELGDNTAALRAAIADDDLLRLALAGDGAEAVVLGHTRWASVGIISEPNAHPVCSEELDGIERPYVAAALNGDVDNHADLRAAEAMTVAPEITTDAKVIPALTARRMAEGHDPDEAFRRTVAAFEGSVAIASTSATNPDRLHLALRGSGQALYVGLAEDAFIVASEPYGLVEETTSYLRLDGETPANPDNPTASRGQVVVLDGARAGTVEGLTRFAYDGTELPVTGADLETAEITTRDIDRGDFPHFLLKEMTESPGSFRKTLRGRLVERDGALHVDLGPEALPDDLRRRLRAGAIRRVLVTGQGTAAVAGQSLAATLDALTAGHELLVDSVVATELSGFELAPDMADTLVVAISQSGTTTDTNRTVDLVRARGGAVVAVVNRRGSDLTDKADGVLYTSDGRDVEMSVASTKAFYAQVAAGVLLAAALADELGVEDTDGTRASMLAALRALPDAMATVLAGREHIGRVARELAPPRRYWAMVGNGPNRIAAAELRIKLSELCYKSIACDVTEDKKHIDLSSEPLILVCAAGLTGSTADDVAKEVAIYRAHKAAPVVIATEGEGRFGSALHVLPVPATHPRLAFVLSALAGHLFGYEAALAIDEGARPLREARAAIEGAVGEHLDGADAEALLDRLRPQFETVADRFFDALRTGAYDGHLEASTASRLASLLRYALGWASLEGYQAETGKVGTPAVVLEDLTAGLTRAIEELTRPVDAIKHQAKTVTVGISRTDETLLAVPLVQAVMDAGAPRDGLTYQALRTLADLDPAIAEVTGWTRYRIEGRPEDGDATIVALDRGGVAAGIPTRTDSDQRLRGTKNRVAAERQVLVATGRRDDRPIVLVPETKDGQTTGLTLLHVRFADRLSAATARGVLQGYRHRFALLRDAVTETEPTFREDLLAEIPVADLLVASITSLADRFRT